VAVSGRLATLVTLAALVLALGACGRKGPPVPPGARAPRTVTGLSGFIEEDGTIHLSWTSPVRRIDNVRLRDLAVERVYRVEDDGFGAPKPAILSRGRIPGYRELVVIRFPPPLTSTTAPRPPAPPLPPGVTVEGEHVRMLDKVGVATGRRYTYTVIVEDSEGRESAPATRLSLTMLAQAQPPGALTARAGEGQVELSWQPPTRLTDGEPVEGTLTYEVLRAPDEDAPLAPITPVPIAAQSFVDRGVANDHTYTYAVRTIRAEDTTTVRGRPSARVSATPRDVTPPAPPARLVAIPSAGTVRLRWEASPDADVARYIVYRADAGGSFTRVGSVVPPLTAFIDQDVPTGSYRYAVTAIDAAATPNESPHSNEVSVSVP
jgi:hypothetical protein